MDGAGSHRVHRPELTDQDLKRLFKIHAPLPVPVKGEQRMPALILFIAVLYKAQVNLP